MRKISRSKSAWMMIGPAPAGRRDRARTAPGRQAGSTCRRRRRPRAEGPERGDRRTPRRRRRRAAPAHARSRRSPPRAGGRNCSRRCGGELAANLVAGRLHRLGRKRLLRRGDAGPAQRLQHRLEPRPPFVGVFAGVDGQAGPGRRSRAAAMIARNCSPARSVGTAPASATAASRSAVKTASFGIDEAAEDGCARAGAHLPAPAAARSAAVERDGDAVEQSVVIFHGQAVQQVERLDPAGQGAALPYRRAPPAFRSTRPRAASPSTGYRCATPLFRRPTSGSTLP